MVDLYEDATPSPADLIRSISEQGYSLQAALADLIDNSVSAKSNKIEIVVSTDSQPYILFMADDGIGMDDNELAAAMKLPSQSPINKRSSHDLGRFGLGMKTASFSQARKFTVLSRKKGHVEYSARTWDLNVLEQGHWRITVNSGSDKTKLLGLYRDTSKLFLNAYTDFEPNTIVVWHGLYKFEEFVTEKNRKETLFKELKEIIAEHLSIVFHRFLEQRNNNLQIRLNNTHIKPFNPFPTRLKDFRSLEPRTRDFHENDISIEGFILPARAITESKAGNSEWTTKYLGLLDMEGIYVYRAGRLISIGGWGSLVKKTSKHQLARLRVDIGNNSDLHLHLNVAKSQVKIPDDLRPAFTAYIKDLKKEAFREYHNKIIKQSIKKGASNEELLQVVPTSRGSTFEINKNFLLFKTATDGLNKIQSLSLKAMIRLLTVKLNMIKESHQPALFPVTISDEDPNPITEEDLLTIVKELSKGGMSKKAIRNDFIRDLGYDKTSIPSTVVQFLEQ